MPGPEREEFKQIADELTAEVGPILGYQMARLGADRMTEFIEAHGMLQAMALFLVMSVTTVPQVGYGKEALDILRRDADDLRQAGERFATMVERLANEWESEAQ